MAVMLDGSRRDAVYQFVLLDMVGIGDIPSLVRHGSIERAKQQRRRFEQDMRLLDQLGWEPEGRKDTYAITLPPDDIRSIFGRLLEQSTRVVDETLAEFTIEVLSDAASMAETAKIVLSGLPGGSR